MAQLTTYPRGLLTLTGSLLTQVEASEAASLATVTGQAAGLVVSGRDALQVRRAPGTVAGVPGPAAGRTGSRYKGNRRKLASEPFDPGWISRQRQARPARDHSRRRVRPPRGPGGPAAGAAAVRADPGNSHAAGAGELVDVRRGPRPAPGRAAGRGPAGGPGAGAPR